VTWGRWVKRAFIALTCLLVLLSFLPLWQTDRWWVRQWDYPRLQVAALLLICLAALPFIKMTRRQTPWLLGGAMSAALAWQASHFLAYIPPYPKQVRSITNCPPDRQISLLNANVLLTNSDYRPLLEMVRRTHPDVLLLLETGGGWAQATRALDRLYPYRLAEPVPNTYGMILLSRLPMEGRVTHLLQAGIPSAHARLRLRDGQTIAFHGLHPEPPWPGDDSGERDAELVTVGRNVRDDGRAAIVIGDLNDVAWSRTSRLFKDIAGMNDPRVGRGFYPTFNANYPLLRWPLDHLFVSPHFQLMAIEVLPDIGSDHFPIFFRLCLTRPAGQRLVARSASADEEAEATDELREGRMERREENAQ